MKNPQEELDKVWRGWTIKEALGEGAFGKVYAIERNEFGNVYRAALKVLEVPQSQSEVKSIRTESMDESSVTNYFYGMVENVVAEFTLMSKLQGNSNIVSYQDHAVVEKQDEFGWIIFIRMELLKSLNDILQSEILQGRDFLKIGMDICKALEVCSQYNIIHRDIKPDNIFRSDTGEYKLGDFGIARQLEKTMVGLSRKGTFSYMAPEVYNQQSYNATVDIYSLGILLYRFFNNNRMPFLPPYPEPVAYSDKDAAERIRLSGEDMPAPCNAGESLSRVIRKACAYKPIDRYQTAKELYDDLAILYAQGDASEQNRTADQTVVLWDLAEETLVTDTDKTVPVKDIPAPEVEKKSRLPLVVAAVFGCVVVLTAGLVFLRTNMNRHNESDADVAISAESGEWAGIERNAADKIGTTFDANFYACDISGIVHYMKKQYGEDIMNRCQIYELDANANNYVIQMQDEDIVKYLFIIPEAEPDRYQALNADGLFFASSDGGVFYLEKNIRVTAPVVPDSMEEVSVNGKDFVLKIFTIQDYPEWQKGHPASAYILTDSKERIRRILLMTAGDRLLRSDITYDGDDRVIKTHGLGVTFGTSQWQALSWQSAEGNTLEATEEEVGTFLKDSILKMPYRFTDSILDGIEEDSNAEYGYDSQGNLSQVHIADLMGDNDKDWSFTYGDGGRVKAEKTASLPSGDSEREAFTLERDADGLLVTLISVDESSNAGNGDENSQLVEIHYSYNADGSMVAE